MRKIIYILSHGTRWKVKCDHCGEEIKNTKIEAIKLARRHVAALPAGTLAQILAQRDNGRFEAEWTYGQDPYPPTG